VHRGRANGKAARNNKLSFGDYGLQTLGAGWITAQQIEAARTAVTRHMKRRGKLWIKIFPDKPFTKKPLEVRMGKGKGNPEGWVAVVRPGNVILEISGCTETVAREALARAANKLPVSCKFMLRQTA
jgi:large subunit ribosomal protein L16